MASGPVWISRKLSVRAISKIVTAATILLIERTDSCSPVREIHTGPLVMS